MINQISNKEEFSYKNTPIGILPEEWDVTSLGDLFSLKQGKFLSQKHRVGDNFKPFLRTSNIYWNKVDLSNLDEMNFTANEELELHLQPGDLLVCEGGDIGRTAMWEGQLDQCYFQNHLHRLRRINNDIYPQYYAYWMQAAFQQFNLYGGEGNKTTIPNLSQGRLKSFLVPKPSFEEQRAIAHVLTTVRQAIEATEKVIEAARQLKRSMMQYLFTYGPVPLADAEHVFLKETEVGEVPEEWDVIAIGDISLQTQYGINSRGMEFGSYPVLRMNNLVDGKVDTTNLKYVDLDEVDFNKYHLEKGDILFNRTNSIDLVGKTSIFEILGDYVFASYLLKVIVDKKKLLPEFLNYLMNWEKAQSRLRMMATRGVSQSNISASKLREFRFQQPPLDNQNNIVKLLQSIDNKIQHEIKQKGVLEELFSSLLQFLMTGKLRVQPLSTSKSPEMGGESDR